MFFSRDDCPKSSEIARLQEQMSHIQENQNKMSTKMDRLADLVESNMYTYIKDTSYEHGEANGKKETLKMIHRFSVSVGYLLVAGGFIAAGKAIGAGEALSGFFNSLIGR